MFTVIIPVHNKAKHLKRSLESVLSQTYSHFELIVVDDASTDESLNILQSYSDPRIRIFRRKTPGAGGYAARNLGIREAKFGWVAFLDADDEWDKARLGYLAELSRNFPDAKILSSGWMEFFNDNEIYLDDYSQKYPDSSAHRFDIYTLLLDKQPICTSVAVIDKDLLLRVNGFDEKWKRGADLELWLRLLLTGAKGAWLNERTAVYYKNATNMVTLNNPFDDSPVFPTLKKHIKTTRRGDLNVALKKFNNRINYGVSRSLLSKNGDYRAFFLRNFIFDLQAFNKVFIASLLLFVLPKRVSISLIRRKIL